MNIEKKTSSTEYANEITELFNDIVKLSQARTRRDNDRLRIKTAYRPLLKALVDNEGVTQLGLVDLTGLKAPTVSITLRLMEDAGLVDRKDDEIDLRKTHVYITDAGREMLQRISVSDDAVQRDLLSGLGDSECDALMGLLLKIKSNLSPEK